MHIHLHECAYMGGVCTETWSLMHPPPFNNSQPTDNVILFLPPFSLHKPNTGLFWSKSQLSYNFICDSKREGLSHPPFFSWLDHNTVITLTEIITESYCKGTLLMQTLNLTGTKGDREEPQTAGMVTGRLAWSAELLIPSRMLFQNKQSISFVRQPGSILRLLARIGTGNKWKTKERKLLQPGSHCTESQHTHELSLFPFSSLPPPPLSPSQI